MSQSIKIRNFNSANLIERGKLSAAVVAAATSLPVENSQGFNVDDNILIGSQGSESSEVRVISAVGSDTELTVDALVFDHQIYEQIFSLFGTKAKIYRASNVDGTLPADGDFTVYAEVSLDLDQLETTFTDDTGGSDYWYKFTYYNVDADTETALADSRAARGTTSGSHYASLDEIREKAGFKNNPNITDTLVSQNRTAAEDEINSSLLGIYTVPFTAPINPTINKITIDLAAGFLLTSQFSSMNSAMRASGEGMIKEARSNIMKLTTKDIELLTPEGSTAAIANSSGFSAWPDSTTADADEENGGAARRFRMGHRY